jgi:hypothetical protein
MLNEGRICPIEIDKGVRPYGLGSRGFGFYRDLVHSVRGPRTALG